MKGILRHILLLVGDPAPISHRLLSKNSGIKYRLHPFDLVLVRKATANPQTVQATATVLGYSQD